MAGSAGHPACSPKMESYPVTVGNMCFFKHAFPELEGSTAIEREAGGQKQQRFKDLLHQRWPISWPLLLCAETSVSSQNISKLTAY